MRKQRNAQFFKGKDKNNKTTPAAKPQRFDLFLVLAMLDWSMRYRAAISWRIHGASRPCPFLSFRQSLCPNLQLLVVGSQGSCWGRVGSYIAETRSWSTSMAPPWHLLKQLNSAHVFVDFSEALDLSLSCQPGAATSGTAPSGTAPPGAPGASPPRPAPSWTAAPAGAAASTIVTP